MTGSAWRGRRWLCGEMVVVMLEGAAAEDGYATGQSKRVSWLPGLLPYPATSALAAAAASWCALARRRHHHIITSCANTRSQLQPSLLFYFFLSFAQDVLLRMSIYHFNRISTGSSSLSSSATPKNFTQHNVDTKISPSTYLLPTHELLPFTFTSA